jgi:hypothetical protein
MRIKSAIHAFQKIERLSSPQYHFMEQIQNIQGLTCLINSHGTLPWYVSVMEAEAISSNQQTALLCVDIQKY